jgi:hypothetical protein
MIKWNGTYLFGFVDEGSTQPGFQLPVAVINDKFYAPPDFTIDMGGGPASMIFDGTVSEQGEYVCTKFDIVGSGMDFSSSSFTGNLYEDGHVDGLFNNGMGQTGAVIGNKIIGDDKSRIDEGIADFDGIWDLGMVVDGEVEPQFSVPYLVEANVFYTVQGTQVDFGGGPQAVECAGIIGKDGKFEFLHFMTTGPGNVFVDMCNPTDEWAPGKNGVTSSGWFHADGSVDGAWSNDLFGEETQTGYFKGGRQSKFDGLWDIWFTQPKDGDPNVYNTVASLQWKIKGDTWSTPPGYKVDYGEGPKDAKISGAIDEVGNIALLNYIYDGNDLTNSIAFSNIKIDVNTQLMSGEWDEDREGKIIPGRLGGRRHNPATADFYVTGVYYPFTVNGGYFIVGENDGKTLLTNFKGYAIRWEESNKCWFITNDSGNKFFKNEGVTNPCGNGRMGNCEDCTGDCGGTCNCFNIYSENCMNDCQDCLCNKTFDEVSITLTKHLQGYWESNNEGDGDIGKGDCFVSKEHITNPIIFAEFFTDGTYDSEYLSIYCNATGNSSPDEDNWIAIQDGKGRIRSLAHFSLNSNDLSIQDHWEVECKCKVYSSNLGKDYNFGISMYANNSNGCSLVKEAFGERDLKYIFSFDGDTDETRGEITDNRTEAHMKFVNRNGYLKGYVKTADDADWIRCGGECDYITRLEEGKKPHVMFVNNVSTSGNWVEVDYEFFIIRNITKNWDSLYDIDFFIGPADRGEVIFSIPISISDNDWSTPPNFVAQINKNPVPLIWKGSIDTYPNSDFNSTYVAMDSGSGLQDVSPQIYLIDGKMRSTPGYMKGDWANKLQNVNGAFIGNKRQQLEFFNGNWILLFIDDSDDKNVVIRFHLTVSNGKFTTSREIFSVDGVPHTVQLYGDVKDFENSFTVLMLTNSPGYIVTTSASYDGADESVASGSGMHIEIEGFLRAYGYIVGTAKVGITDILNKDEFNIVGYALEDDYTVYDGTYELHFNSLPAGRPLEETETVFTIQIVVEKGEWYTVEGTTIDSNPAFIAGKIFNKELVVECFVINNVYQSRPNLTLDCVSISTDGSIGEEESSWSDGDPFDGDRKIVGIKTGDVSGAGIYDGEYNFVLKYKDNSEAAFIPIKVEGMQWAALDTFTVDPGDGSQALAIMRGTIDRKGNFEATYYEIPDVSAVMLDKSKNITGGFAMTGIISTAGHLNGTWMAQISETETVTGIVEGAKNVIKKEGNAVDIIEFTQIQHYGWNNVTNAVDGDPNTFAVHTRKSKTSILDTINDPAPSGLLMFILNECNGTVLGEITKVEVGINCYLETNSLNLFLMPMFNQGLGVGNRGELFSISGDDMVTYKSNIINWIDITEPGGGIKGIPWTWDIIKYLQLGVGDENVDPGVDRTTYINKAYIRITYVELPIAIVLKYFPTKIEVEIGTAWVGAPFVPGEILYLSKEEGKNFWSEGRVDLPNDNSNRLRLEFGGTCGTTVEPAKLSVKGYISKNGMFIHAFTARHTSITEHFEFRRVYNSCDNFEVVDDTLLPGSLTYETVFTRFEKWQPEVSSFMLTPAPHTIMGTDARKVTSVMGLLIDYPFLYPEIWEQCFLANFQTNYLYNRGYYRNRNYFPPGSITQAEFPIKKLIIHFQKYQTFPFVLKDVWVGHAEVGDLGRQEEFRQKYGVTRYCNFEEEPIRVTFNDGDDIVDLTNTATVKSDPIAFEYDPTKPLLVSYYPHEYRMRNGYGIREAGRPETWFCDNGSSSSKNVDNEEWVKKDYCYVISKIEIATQEQKAEIVDKTETEAWFSVMNKPPETSVVIPTNMSFRIVLTTDDISYHSGNKVRLTFQAVCNAWKYEIEGCYIGYRDGLLNFADEPTRVTFNNGSNQGVVKDFLISDSIVFNFDREQEMVISVKMVNNYQEHRHPCSLTPSRGQGITYACKGGSITNRNVAEDKWELLPNFLYSLVEVECGYDKKEITILPARDKEQEKQWWTPSTGKILWPMICQGVNTPDDSNYIYSELNTLCSYIQFTPTFLGSMNQIKIRLRAMTPNRSVGGFSFQLFDYTKCNEAITPEIKIGISRSNVWETLETDWMYASELFTSGKVSGWFLTLKSLVLNTQTSIYISELELRVRYNDEWCNKAHLHLCTAKESCETAGGYWYEGKCHVESATWNTIFKQEQTAAAELILSHTFRNLIPTQELDLSGTTIQLTLLGYKNESVTIRECYIGYHGSNLHFNRGAGIKMVTFNERTFANFEGSIISDLIEFTYDPTKELLVAFKIGVSDSSDGQKFYGGQSRGLETYFSGNPTSDASDDGVDYTVLVQGMSFVVGEVKVLSTKPIKTITATPWKQAMSYASQWFASTTGRELPIGWEGLVSNGVNAPSTSYIYADQEQLFQQMLFHPTFSESVNQVRFRFLANIKSSWGWRIVVQMFDNNQVQLVEPLIAYATVDEEWQVIETPWKDFTKGYMVQSDFETANVRLISAKHLDSPASIKIREIEMVLRKVGK